MFLLHLFAFVCLPGRKKHFTSSYSGLSFSSSVSHKSKAFWALVPRTLSVSSKGWDTSDPINELTKHLPSIQQANDLWERIWTTLGCCRLVLSSPKTRYTIPVVCFSNAPSEKPWRTLKNHRKNPKWIPAKPPVLCLQKLQTALFFFWKSGTLQRWDPLVPASVVRTVALEDWWSWSMADLGRIWKDGVGDFGGPRMFQTPKDLRNHLISILASIVVTSGRGSSFRSMRAFYFGVLCYLQSLPSGGREYKESSFRGQLAVVTGPSKTSEQ